MSIKLWVRGTKSPITLSDHDFIAEGGEGRVYGQGNKVYKISLNGKLNIPEGKILKLQQLTHPNIIKPIDLLIDKNNQLIGYSMKRVSGTALSRFFTTDYQTQIGYKEKQLEELILNLRNGFNYLHNEKILVVDANENNFIIDDQDNTTPYFIDVGSYEVPGYPATAIADGIRDYHTNGFNQNSDWFSFAILVSQLFLGIHPYKGKHPDYKKTDLIARMKDNVSIFNPKVSLPSVVRDFSSIPGNWLDWLKAVLENGERCSPPDSMKAAVQKIITKNIINSTAGFDIKLVKEYEENITDYRYVSGNTIIKFGVGHFEVNKIQHKIPNANTIIVTDKSAKPWAVTSNKTSLDFTDYNSNAVLSMALSNKQNYVIGNYLISTSDNKLNAISGMELGNNVYFTVKKQWDIMPNSTVAYDGCLLSNMLGQPFAIIFNPNTVSTHYINIKELIGHKIINAKYSNQVLVVTANQNGLINRMVFKFNSDFTQYSVDIENDVDTGEINFTVMDSGIVIMIPHDDELWVFGNNWKKPDIKKISSPVIKSDMKLCNNGIGVMFYQGNKLYSIKMV
jgi:serine/threonine protein kinase